MAPAQTVSKTLTTLTGGVARSRARRPTCSNVRHVAASPAPADDYELTALSHYLVSGGVPAHATAGMFESGYGLVALSHYLLGGGVPPHAITRLFAAGRA